MGDLNFLGPKIKDNIIEDMSLKRVLEMDVTMKIIEESL